MDFGGFFNLFLDFLRFFEEKNSGFISEKNSGRFDISGSMIRLSVPEIIKLNSRVVLDGACDDDYDDL